MFFKAGDLASSTLGNIGLIIDAYKLDGEHFVDIQWIESGFLRTCYPTYKLSHNLWR
jgi:hypothetical protein